MRTTQATPRPTRRKRLPMRYLLPLLLLVALVAMLMLRGYVHSEISADHRVRDPAPTDRVPEKIIDGGPVIDARTPGKPDSLQIPDHKMRRTGVVEAPGNPAERKAVA
ncbi:bi-functional transferase/deacetylase [Streptomyces xanthochromogenes]